MNWQSSVVDPVLHVVVVGFHHKKGCQVEYSYPPLVEGNDVASHECPKKWKHLPSLALPDGAHNYSEDTIYFHLPSLDGSQNTIFGVSCCQQIDACEVLNKTEDVTRNTIQKSVCVLSRLPVFGLIRVKLEMITHAYFKGRDFSQVELLEDTYSTLNSSLTECLLQNSHINLGLSGRELLKMFRHKLVVLFKLFLLEKKVLFFSSPVKPICTSILAISSLFPGLIEQGLFESARFDAAQMTPTIETGLSFQLPKDANESIIPEPPTHDPQDVNQDTKAGISISLQKDSIAEHSDRKAGNLAKSLQHMPQQKWPSITFSQLRNKFFSNFKGNDGSPSQSFFFTSLPSIPVSTDRDGKLSPKNNSMFYSKDSTILDPAESYRQETANSTFFIAPDVCQTSKFDDKSAARNPVENSNQAPIHFSRQSSHPVEKPRSRSVNIDVKDEKALVEYANRSLPSNFERNPKFASKLETSRNPPVTKVAGKSENRFDAPTISEQTLASACEMTRSCDANLEDMLVDDDDEIIFKEGQHRLEINEFPPDPMTQEMEYSEVRSFSELKVIKSTENLPLHLKPIQDFGSSSFVAGSDNFGLPLMIFSKGVLCHPYLSLHLYDILTDPGVRGFVIGATNALFKQRRQLLDVIIELNEARIDTVDGDLKRCLALSTADLRFADNLVKSLIEESGDPFLDNTGWEGGDDWIRSQFRSYLMSLLATVDHGDEKMEEDFNPSFIEAWKTTHNYKVWKENSPYEVLSSIPAQHICRGNLSMSDVKLKINQVINNGGKERRITSVVNQTVSQTGKAVGAAVNLAKSTVSSWFGGFSSKD